MTKLISPNVVVMLVLVLMQGQFARAQAWRVEGDRLLQNGKPAFLIGANYLPSKHWLTILRAWDGEVVERDMQAMQSIGVRYIRFFPPWSLIQTQTPPIWAAEDNSISG